MRLILLLLVFSAQTIFAGLERYSNLVVSGGSSGLQITYLGTNGFQLRSGNHVLVIDPYFSRIDFSGMTFGGPVLPDVNRIDAGMKYLSRRAEAIVVTHGHVDHLLDVPVVMQRTGARMIGSRTAAQLVGRAGIPAARCEAVTAGGERRIGPWKIRALAASHDRLLGKIPFPGESRGSGAPRRAGDWVCGEPLAYLIEIHGQRIYIDSGGTPASLPPANIGPVDLAILGVALPDSRERFSAALQRLRPRFVFPSHQDDFFRPLDSGFHFGLLTDFPRVLRDHSKAAPTSRLILLEYFKPWVLPKN